MSDAAVVVGDDPLTGCDFSILGPTLEQKQLMVSMVLQKIETAASVVKKYLYNRKHLHKMIATGDLPSEEPYVYWTD